MDLLIRWLLTYLLHSTLLLGSVALLGVLLGLRRLGLQEALLRAALVGGFVTASLQVGLDLRPVGGALAVPETSPRARAAEQEAIAAADDLAASMARDPIPLATAAAGGDVGRGNALTLVAGAADWARSALPAWPTLLLTGWITLAFVFLVRLAVASLRLRGLLRGRRPLTDGAIAASTRNVADALGLRGPIRLSAAPRIQIPLATGVLRPEVCLPTRAVEDLPAEEQLALCAHELAHVARRDPAWLLLNRLAEALAPLQPLNGWARRRLEDLAECLSDDLAVSASAAPIGLARSLLEVASWTLPGQPVVPATAAGAFRARHRLALRVERIMNPVRRLERPGRLLLPLAVAGVLATTVVTPVVSGGTAMIPPPTLASLPAPAALQPPMPEMPPEPPEPPDPAEAPEPMPAPEPAVAPLPPVPPAPPLSPAPPEPPSPPDPPDAERELERIAHRIEVRAHGHEAEMEKLETEIEALASHFEPHAAEMGRLGAEIGKVAGELAAAAIEEAQEGAKGARDEAKLAAAKARMAELKDEMRRVAEQMRIPEEETRALREKARALAEQARPTDEELAEIRHLSERIARDLQPHAEELTRIAREAAHQAREEMHRARLEAHKAHQEAMRAAREDMRGAREQARDLERTHRHHAKAEKHHAKTQKHPDKAKPAGAAEPPSADAADEADSPKK